MEYIGSKNLTLLIRDAFKLIDRRLMDHGSKTSYLFCKMLECTEKYEKFEIADFSILATLHDIGAYKTDNLNDMLRFEVKDYLPHSIYGHLFMKYLSPFEEESGIILYHGTDYSKLKDINYKFKEEAAMLNLAEKTVIYYTALGDKFKPEMFQDYSGTKFSPLSLELLSKIIEKDDVLHRLTTEEYQKDMDEIIKYVIFSDEEKNKYLNMLMYCMGFRSEYTVVDTVTCIEVAKEIGKYMKLKDEEQEQLYYGTLVHDMGMLSIPRSIIDAARKLTPEEFAKMQTHVTIAEKIFNNRLDEKVSSIALAHHERSDGSGYPKKLKESQITKLQAILQVADTMTSLINKRSYRPSLDKEKIQMILREELQKRKFRREVVMVVLENYDEIIEAVGPEVNETLATHRKLQEQYVQVYKILHVKK